MAAQLYDKNLKDKEILIVAKQDKNLIHYNLYFNNTNFKHFTGVHSKLSAESFFHHALNKRLSKNDFDFKDPYLTEKKIRILENAVKLPYTAKIVGEFKYAGIKIQAEVGAGNLNYVMAFRADRKNGRLFPVSILEEDIRNATNPTSSIVAIFSKNKHEELFNHMTYRSKNINIKNIHIPNEIKDMLTEEAYYQLKDVK